MFIHLIISFSLLIKNDSIYLEELIDISTLLSWCFLMFWAHCLHFFLFFFFFYQQYVKLFDKIAGFIWSSVRTCYNRMVSILPLATI